MSQQPAAQFEKAISRSTWRILAFLFVLLLVVLVLAAWGIATLFAGGGAKLFQMQECATNRIQPAAEAAERYHRDKGEYPERIEDVYPVYLSREDVLHCPADPDRRRGASSFRYRKPDPAHPNAPMLVCPNHPVTLTVVRQGPVDPGRTRWVINALPKETARPAPRRTAPAPAGR